MTLPKAQVTQEYPETINAKTPRDISGKVIPYVVRAAVCPEHGRATKEFSGENEGGWVFRCSGLTNGQAKRKHEAVGLVLFPADEDPGVPNQFHYFTAEPA